MGRELDRRTVLGVLVAAAALVSQGCSRGARLALASPQPLLVRPPDPPSPVPSTADPVGVVGAIPAANPGKAHVISAGRTEGSRIALTIDDGFSPPTVAAYVDFAERTGMPLTFAPNGLYREIWERHLDVLVPLIDRGQVQIANHTWSHRNLTVTDERTITTEIERNEEWIERTFKITARPWFRPPYGAHNAEVNDIAGRLGFTNVVLWNGSFGDGRAETAAGLMTQARKYLHAGVIMLGHANYPTVTTVFDQIQDLLEERGLQPVTLDTMFDTSRITG